MLRSTILISKTVKLFFRQKQWHLRVCIATSLMAFKLLTEQFNEYWKETRITNIYPVTGRKLWICPTVLSAHFKNDKSAVRYFEKPVIWYRTLQEILGWLFKINGWKLHPQALLKVRGGTMLTKCSNHFIWVYFHDKNWTLNKKVKFKEPP